MRYQTCHDTTGFFVLRGVECQTQGSISELVMITEKYIEDEMIRL
jgi:hypothetical protein